MVSEGIWGDVDLGRYGEIREIREIRGDTGRLLTLTMKCRNSSLSRAFFLPRSKAYAWLLLVSFDELSTAMKS